MDFYEELRMQEKERIVDSLATENQMLQEPKTPTKEQIIKIHRSNKHLMSLSHYTIELIITEWEKIKNQQ